MANWKKGALHTHTLWSDGRSLPEVLIKTYQGLGYDFVSLTDHNIYQDLPEFLLPVRGEEGHWPPMLSSNEFERYKEMMHEEPEVHPIGVRFFVRLKTFAELHRQFNADGKFLLLPGVEITGMGMPTDDGGLSDCHANIINLPETLTPKPAANSVELFRQYWETYTQAVKRHPDMESLFILDHPHWRLWDTSPLAAIENPQIQFFEIFNGAGEPQPEHPTFTLDQFWDFVLAHRVDRGQQLLYGVASDDAHFTDPERINKGAGCDHGWVMVNIPGEFTASELVRAMKRGDFYACSGVLLDAVEFDKDSHTLSVRIQPADGVKYHIEFIVTKKDFDRTITEKAVPHSQQRFCRRLPVIPDSIGIVASSIEGTSASYTMADDDLYVRAIAIADTPHEFANQPFAPMTKRSWTQPFTWK